MLVWICLRYVVVYFVWLWVVLLDFLAWFGVWGWIFWFCWAMHWSGVVDFVGLLWWALICVIVEVWYDIAFFVFWGY